MSHLKPTPDTFSWILIALISDGSLEETPLKTPLLAYASKNGCRIVDGLGMLIYQAIPGFERWFGVKPADSQDLRELLLKS